MWCVDVKFEISRRGPNSFTKWAPIKNGHYWRVQKSVLFGSIAGKDVFLTAEEQTRDLTL